MHKKVKLHWLVALVVAIAQPSLAQDRFPQLKNADALSKLNYQQPQLPSWARLLVGSLPQTTAAMLRLDYIHRAKNPLNPMLRAKIRWSAADAIGCEYSKRVAGYDLRRSGLAPPAVAQFLETGEAYTPKEEAALKMARKLTTAGHTVTDAEMARLMKFYGPKTVVAIVHTVAHANFQDRIFLAIGVRPVKRPQPPLNLQTRRPRQPTHPQRKPWEEMKQTHKDKVQRKPGWEKRSYAELTKALQTQMKRKSRIALPKRGNGKKPDNARRRRRQVLWNTVSMAYQPELTRAWFQCMNTFHREANLDRVFANSMFWVVTRSNDCFY